MSTRSSRGSSATPEGSARDALRAGTHAAHEAVDRVFGGFDLGSRAGYGAFLRAHAAAFLPLEDALDRFGAERLLPDWADRRRGPALLADLDDLALAPPPFEPAAVSGTAEAWGILYVLEGSRFGGRLIARGLVVSGPRRYIAAGHAPGAWTGLVSRMEQDLASTADRKRALDAAAGAFGRFERAGVALLADRRA